MALSYITIAGVRVQLGRGDVHGWAETSGPTPHVQAFRLSNAQAAKILDRVEPVTGKANELGAGPVTIEISHNGTTTRRWEGLFLVHRGRPAGAHHTVLEIADRRYWWDRIPVRRDYNERRQGPDRRLVGGALTLIQNKQNLPDFTYRRSTMNAGRPWKAIEVLEDVLKRLVGADGYRLEIATDSLQIPVENLHLRGAGGRELARVLAYVAGADVTVDPDGIVRVYSTLDNSEIAQAEALERSQLFRSARWSVPDYSHLRPPEIGSLHEKEVELRFDFSARAAGAPPQTYVPGREPLVAQNVARVTDPTLTVNGSEVTAGTYVLMEDLLTAIAAKGDAPAGLPPLTNRVILDHYLGSLGVVMARYSLGGRLPSQLWSARIGEVQRAWRRLFRVLPQWLDKISSFRAYRVALVNPETGTLCEAQAWCNYLIKPSAIGLRKKGGEKAGWQHTDVYAADLTGKQPAPFAVSIENSDLGIFAIEPRPGLFGNEAAVIPGVAQGELPVFGHGGNVALWNRVKLQEAWDLAVILTVVPDAPNDEGRLHREEVTAADARALLQQGGLGILGATNGPSWDQINDYATARFAWLDSRADEIREAVYTGRALAKDLMVNPTEVEGAAQALAARIYALLLDRGQGEVEVSLTEHERARVTGNAKTVVHAIAAGDPGAVVTSKVIMPPPSGGVDVWHLMPARARDTIMKLVQLKDGKP